MASSPDRPGSGSTVCSKPAVIGEPLGSRFSKRAALGLTRQRKPSCRRPGVGPWRTGRSAHRAAGKDQNSVPYKPGKNDCMLGWDWLAGSKPWEGHRHRQIRMAGTKAKLNLETRKAVTRMERWRARKATGHLWIISGNQRHQRSHQASPEISKAQAKAIEIPNSPENYKYIKMTYLPPRLVWGQGGPCLALCQWSSDSHPTANSPASPGIGRSANSWAPPQIHWIRLSGGMGPAVWTVRSSPGCACWSLKSSVWAQAGRAEANRGGGSRADSDSSLETEKYVSFLFISVCFHFSPSVSVTVFFSFSFSFYCITFKGSHFLLNNGTIIKSDT